MRSQIRPTRKSTMAFVALAASLLLPFHISAQESASMTPEEKNVLNLIETMTSSFSQGNIDGVMDTYERDAVIVFEPGNGVSEEAAVRQAFTQFASMNPSFSYGGHQVVVSGDLALHISPWQMTGTGPDGSEIEGGGLSVAVLRKQSDGTWRMVIDNPFGDLHLQN